MQAAAVNPERIAHWPKETRGRLDRAVLAISVVTLAELRAGQIHANYGPDKLERDGRTISTYLPVPLDPDVAEVWARLWAETRGDNIGDNDLWIAATAMARGWPLVACDRHFLRLADLDLIYLQRTPESRIS